MGNVIVVLALSSLLHACSCTHVSTVEQLIQAASLDQGMSPAHGIVVTNEILLPSLSSPAVAVTSGAVVSILGGGTAATPPTLESSYALKAFFRVLPGTVIIIKRLYVCICMIKAIWSWL